MKRWQADVALGFVALIWGSTFVMVQNALDTVGPLTFVGWRFILATLFLVTLYYHRVRLFTRDDLRAGALIGIWLAMGYVFQTIGLQSTTTAKAGFITGLSVVIVPVLDTVLLRHPPGRGPTVGILAALAGLALLSLNANLSVATGDLWVLGCAFAFGMHLISVSHFSPNHDSVRLAVAQIGTVAVIATGSAFVFETPTLNLPSETWAAIAFTGAAATALAFGLQMVVQRFTTPTHTALLFSLEPVFAAFFGWWLAHEVLGTKEVIGCGLILAGMLIAELWRSPEADSEPAAMHPVMASDAVPGDA